MLKNLINMLGYGQAIVCNGKAQFVITRVPFADNLFLTVDDGAQLPARVNLSTADLARPPRQDDKPSGDQPTDPPGNLGGRQPVVPLAKPEL